MCHITAQELKKSYLSPLRNVKMFYHKVHKEISQRTQSVVIQIVFFAFYVVKSAFQRRLISEI